MSLPQARMKEPGSALRRVREQHAVLDALLKRGAAHQAVEELRRLLGSGVSAGRAPALTNGGADPAGRAPAVYEDPAGRAPALTNGGGADAAVPAAGAPRGVYVLELFSGHGSVAAIASEILGNCPAVTVDRSDEHGVPTVRATLPRDNDAVVRRCKELYPCRVPVVWASPDCTQYSVAKTVGVRDFVTADANVRAVQQIATALNALAVIIENPAGKLVGRDVIRFMPFRYEVHYCKYGRLYRKPTMLWCSHDLIAHGFEPRVCARDCDATYVRNGVLRHVYNVCDFGVDVRVSVPDSLVAAVFRAVSGVVAASGVAAPEAFDPAKPRPARADDVGEVDFIQDSRLDAHGGVELLVAWVGHDHCEWIDAANLDADIEEYDFADDDVRADCVDLLRA